jgi:hypothetical protein
VDNSRFGKNFQPGRSEQRGARFLPTPSRTEIELHSEPKSFGIPAVTKDSSETAANVCPQIGTAILLPFCGPDPFQEWLRIVPSGSNSLQIILVQFLQRSRLTMTIEVLTNL